MNEAMERLRARQQGGGGNVLDAIMQPSAPRGDIVQIAARMLHSFSGHTFRLRPDNDPYMVSLLDSIRENGVLEPLLVRPHPALAGEYEIIAGHTRHYLGTKVGLPVFPCVVHKLSDADATIQMGESNLQRPDWLPSEKAWTYKAHLEAIRQKRQKKQELGSCFSNTDKIQEPSSCFSNTDKIQEPSSCFSTQHGDGQIRDLAAQRWGITGKALEMYIKLADLHPALLDMVDGGRIPVKAGFQLAFLPEGDQDALLALLTENPSVRVREATAKELRVTPREKYPHVLGLETAGTTRRPTWNVALPRDMLGADAKRYLADPELQGRIIAVVRDYITEQKGEQWGNG